jgi:deoxyribodipyrimidine photo-lyase
MGLRTGLLMHTDDLAPLPGALPECAAHAVLRAEGGLSPLEVAPHVSAFLDVACADMQSRLAPGADWARLASVEQVLEWITKNGLKQVVLPYAPVGPVATRVAEAEARSDIPFVAIRRAYDDAAWPHATHGFFKFKDKIPSLVAGLNGIGLAAQ